MCILPSGEQIEEPVSQVEPEQTTKMAAPQVTPPPSEEPSAEPEPVSKPEPVLSASEPPATPTPSPPKAADATPAVPPEPGSEIEHLRLNLRQSIMSAPDGIGRTPAAALLRSAKPKAIEDNVVVLSFKYPLHKENMEKLENQKTAEQIISHFLGRSCRVRCVYEPEDNHLVKAAIKMGAQIIDPEEK